MDVTRRATVRGQATKLVASATSVLNTDSCKANFENKSNFASIKEELSSFIERLKWLHKELDVLDEKISHTVESEHYQKEFDATFEYADKIIDCIARLEMRIVSIDKICVTIPEMIPTVADERSVQNNNNVSANMSSMSRIQLPKIQLKKFGGDYGEWLPFWEQFKELIHENSSLSNTDKFHYLQTALHGKAEVTLAGFQRTCDSYETAVKVLQEEYGDAERLIEKHMQQLMAISPVGSRYDAVSLRIMYNTVLANSRALETLGVPLTNYCMMLKAILIKNLPQELRIQYHRKKEDEEISSISVDNENDDESEVSAETSHSLKSVMADRELQTLLRYLKKEIEALERAGVIFTKKDPSTNKKPPTTAAALVVPADKNNKKFCVFCRANSHYTDKCTRPKPVKERIDILRKEGRCFKCTKRGHMSANCSNKNIRCSECKGNHATVICQKSAVKGNSVPNTHSENPEDTQSTNLCSFDNCASTIYLQTACARASSSDDDKSLLIRLVLDNGSQRSYITEAVANNLKLPVVGVMKMRVQTFGSSDRTPVQSFNKVRVQIHSLFTDEIIQILAIVVPTICLDILPAPEPNLIPQISNLKLADTVKFGRPEKGISMLIGADTYWRVVTRDILPLTSDLTAVNTRLGWTIQGPFGQCHDYDPVTLFVPVCVESDDDLDFEAKNMWSLENIGITPPENHSEVIDLDKYVRRVGDRYEASLLWSTVPTSLDSYKKGAFMRFESLVKKLKTVPQKMMEYDAAINDLISNGIAEVVPAESHDGPTYYLPHRPVYREDKSTTKLRVVFDASAKYSGNSSLNDHLDAGTNLLPDVLEILLNFRTGPVALTADVEKAFLQIKLAIGERDTHRFFWFSQPIQTPNRLPNIQEFRMTRVTFGIKCSPFLLGATLQSHLNQNSDDSNVINMVKKAIYMDDVVMSVENEKTAEDVIMSTTPLLKEISMNLRKWNSNSDYIRNVILGEMGPSDEQKVLGMNWNCVFDELSVDSRKVIEYAHKIGLKPTKRQILMLLARIFDPFGMMGPFSVKLKVLFQKMWKKKLNWDDPLPAEFDEVWRSCLKEFTTLENMTIPRWFGSSGPAQVQLHLFGDASPSAYGTVAYLRIVLKDSTIVRFCSSKNKIAPLKDVDRGLTLPKLELTAALLASRLRKYLIDKLSIEINEVVMWTDSRITLFWIQGAERRWKPYVAKRVTEIKQNSLISEWRHCPGNCNPADFLTRGTFGKNLCTSSTWLDGPSWLQREEDWPVIDEIDTTVDYTSLSVFELHEKEQDITTLSSGVGPPFEIGKMSTLTRVLRVTAYLKRFIQRSRKYPVSNQFLVASDLLLAKQIWITITQKEFYSEEVSALKSGKPILRNSKILTLNPVLDDQGIIRLGSRLEQSGDSYAERYPIILPKAAHFTKLIVLDIHQRMLHAGVTSVLCRLREEFWIPQARQLVKTTLKGCGVCRRLFSKAASQPFAPLPRDRMVASRPFETTGLDFAGPLFAVNEGGKPQKVYILILTCAVVRAVHLELVLDMTVNSCLLALRRFFSRRGVPRIIMSDNARTFKRAAKEFEALGSVICSEHFRNQMASYQITWKYIVERAPWWGGFWERLIRNVKSLLKATIGRETLKVDELQTILTEAESIMNSRPLTYVSDDPVDLHPLTPSHFLQSSIFSGTSKNSIITDPSHDLKQKWRARFKQTQLFWKRWRTEYLQLLRSAHHVKSCPERTLKEGEVVLVHDPSTPRLFWKLALIQKAYPGRDGRVRSCEIRYHDGSVTRRPVQLLYPLEVPSEMSPSARAQDVENN